MTLRNKTPCILFLLNKRYLVDCLLHQRSCSRRCERLFLSLPVLYSETFPADLTVSAVKFVWTLIFERRQPRARAVKKMRTAQLYYSLSGSKGKKNAFQDTSLNIGSHNVAGDVEVYPNKFTLQDRWERKVLYCKPIYLYIFFFNIYKYIV